MSARAAENVVRSAFSRGAVLGSPDDGLVNVVSDALAVTRGEIAGFNSQVLGKYRILHPRLSKADYVTLQASGLPEVPGFMDNLLASVPGLPDAARQQLAMTRKAVVQTMADGSERVIVVPAVPAAATELEILRAEGEDPVAVGEVPDEVELAARPKSRTYTLGQFFWDAPVINKYDIPIRQYETAKRIAVNNPKMAAQVLQDAANMCQDTVAVKVVAGEYASDRPQARSALRTVCSGYERVDMSVQADIVIDEIFMYGPGRRWHVRGPLKLAAEVSFMYWFVYHEGPVIPSKLMAMELVLLSIDIHDGHSYEEPQIEFHAGGPGDVYQDVRLDPETLSKLSAVARASLDELAARLTTITYPDGEHMASAVRVTDRYTLMNSHVIDGNPACLLGGKPVQVKSQLARDLWYAVHPGHASPWPMRDPELNEWVSIFYKVGDQMACSAPLQVVNINDESIVMTMHASVGYGSSGGAVVALSDMSLLGVHSSATPRNLMACRFGAAKFMEIYEYDSVSSFNRLEDPETFAFDMMDHMKRKGLRPVLQAAIGSLIPLYGHGIHVGMATKRGDTMYTTCDPGIGLQVGDGRDTTVWGSVQGTSLVSAGLTVAGRTEPVYSRAPRPFEKVFVLGFDSDAFVSNETTVSYVGVDAKKFVIRDLETADKSLSGGLVMGWDCAVLGLCGPRSFDTAAGIGYPCCSLPRPEVSVVEPPGVAVQKLFPFLNTAAWPHGLAEEVLTHTSVGRYTSGGTFNAGNRPLANVGDNIAKAKLYSVFRSTGRPHGEWSAEMQRVQSNARMAAIAWESGLAEVCRVGPGANFPKDAKVYADVVEALVGAAHLAESPEVVDELCVTLGLVPADPTRDVFFDADSGVGD